ncbi:Glutathione transport system permease protein GsiC [Leucobacter aridicollis]|uniref:ABC transporter permease n=1 Tax=Leucobacter aridicollis TaxID=283878 RepID=UPI00216918BF|nr:ABC transporter permease [Leucobacter aridicollis]MCS3427801.1 peptide/nickel transport system permease protein [Leucobacter aridicollis]
MPHAIRKLAGMLVTLVIASFIIFAAMFAAPGDPVTFLIGNPENMTPERIASVRAQYHLDQPMLAQYWHWASGALTGNFGESFKYHQPVADIMAARIPTTLSLVAYAAVLLVIFGIGLGVVAAVRRRTAVDSLIVSGTTLAASIPSFVLGIALVALFSVQLRWFPVAGIGSGGVWAQLYHLTLPALTLAITALAIVSRVTRQTMIEQFTSEHVEAARATGLRERFIVRDHVLRNAWGPIITMVALVIASMIAGTVAVETVFGLSGVGSLLVDAINTHDFPVVQAVLLFMVVAYMIVTTVVDLLLPVLDPRISAKVATR